MAKRETDTPKVRPKIGEATTPRRASKAKGRDYTDPYRHRVRAYGGPIERRTVTLLPGEEFLSFETLKNRGLTDKKG